MRRPERRLRSRRRGGEQVLILPAELAMVATARRVVGAALAGTRCGDEAVLVAGELLVDAVRHSSGQVRLRLRVGERVRIEVADQRGQHPRLPPLPVEEGAPDALALVSALARRIGAERAETGDCATWAELDPGTGVSHAGRDGWLGSRAWAREFLELADEPAP